MTRSVSPPTRKARKGPGKQRMALIREAFDADKLIQICEMDDFSSYAPRFELTPDGNRKRFYHHIDNGSDILAVAHLDHVQANATCQVVDTAAGLLALSGALDDRLGVYVITELLPKLGITCDWLLTTDEERGASTAEDFVTTKDYNWIIEFDRGGTDVVMYDYETEDLVDLVEASGARVGTGIWSDICVLEFLGCAAFNWGVGYQDYHSAKSHAWLEDTFRMVARFMKFYEANAGTYLRHEPTLLTWNEETNSWDDDAKDDYAQWWADATADIAEDAEDKEPSYDEAPPYDAAFYEDYDAYDEWAFLQTRHQKGA